MKRSNLTFKIIVGLLFAAVVVYLGVYVVSSLTAGVRTAPAVYVSVERTGSATGIIVRSEELLQSAESNLSIAAESGSIVARGEVLAVVYGSAEALARENRIRELELARDYIASVLSGAASPDDVSDRDRAIKSAITELSAAAARKDSEGIAAASMELDNLVVTTSQTGVTQDDLARVDAELNQLRQTSSGDVSRIYASRSGLFTAFADGYEALSPAMLDGLSADNLQKMAESGQDIPAEVYGKMVEPGEWYFAAVMSYEDAGSLELGGETQLDFGRYCSKSVPCTVRSIGMPNENDECAVVFRCTQYTADLLPVRKVTADIVFDSVEGIRVPREAVLQDEAGSYVYTVTGLQCEKKHITIIRETEEYYLAAIDSAADALRAGNDIILNTKGLYDGKVISG